VVETSCSKWLISQFQDLLVWIDEREAAGMYSCDTCFTALISVLQAYETDVLKLVTDSTKCTLFLMQLFTIFFSGQGQYMEQQHSRHHQQDLFQHLILVGIQGTCRG
jgi:hypothetical protein